MDIARSGDDETCIYRARRRLGASVSGAQPGRHDGHRWSRSKAIRDINGEQGLNDWVEAALDEVGGGGGVLDRLLEQGIEIAGWNAGKTPVDTERFRNQRAEQYWMLPERFEQGEIDIDPNDDKLAAQLGAIKWTADSRGRIKIESKDDARKRGVPSPDRADAVVLSFLRDGAAAVVPLPDASSGRSISGELMQKAW